MNAIEKWYEVIKSDNPDKYDEVLAEDCVFYSPVVYTPQRGREITKMYLMAAGGVFGGEDSPKKILDEKNISMAKPDDVKKITGYTIGGVSPVGHLNKVKIYIDTNLERFKTVFAAAGHPNCVFKIEFNQLTKLTSGEIKEITE